MQDELGAGAGQGYLLYSRTPLLRGWIFRSMPGVKLFAGLGLVEWLSHLFGEEPDFSKVFFGFLYYGIWLYWLLPLISSGHGSPASLKALHAMVFSMDSRDDPFFFEVAWDAALNPSSIFSSGHGSPFSAKALHAMVSSTDSNIDSFSFAAFPVLMGHGSPASAKALHAKVSSTSFFNKVFFSSMDKPPVIAVFGLPAGRESQGIF